MSLKKSSYNFNSKTEQTSWFKIFDNKCYKFLNS